MGAGRVEAAQRAPDHRTAKHELHLRVDVKVRTPGVVHGLHGVRRGPRDFV